MQHEDPLVARMRAESAIASARTALLVVGIIGVLGIALIYLPALSEYGTAIFQIPAVLISLVVDVCLVASYFVCRAVAVKRPAPALLAALILFCTAWALSVLFGERAWHAGILLRGVVLFFLVRGLMASSGLNRPAVNPDVFE